MAHIHLEDGAFTLQWISIWWILAIVLIGLCLYWLKKDKGISNKTITIAAMLTAAAFAIFQVNMPLFGGVHMNLTPLIGIFGGPAVGGVIVLIVNVLSAAIGHGVNGGLEMLRYGGIKVLRPISTYLLSIWISKQQPQRFCGIRPCFLRSLSL